LSNVDIAARLDSNPEVIGRWRSRFQRERLAGLEDRARSGHPRRFSNLLQGPWVVSPAW
jgi:transposase